MTERTLGSNFKWFVAKVVNRGDGKQGEKDKTESGRVQIRVYGKHDDEKNIPDSALPWAIPMMPINSGAGRDGVSGSPVGLKKDSQVVGFYADEDESIPILMGVLLRAGKDQDQSQDAQGEGVTPQNNDAPKGSRTADTQGSDKNDVLKTNNSLVSDVASKDQLHLSKPTIGSAQYDGSSVLNSINKVDPSNLSGSIPGALSGMKSMTSTMSVAGSLLSNFSAIASGKFNLNSLLTLAATAVALKNYNPAQAAANLTKSTMKNAAGNIAGNLVGQAFSGKNPMEAILGGLGGLNGLKGLMSMSTTVLGPLSGNFGAAAAIAGTLKGIGKSTLAGIKPAPIPIPFGLSTLGNITRGLNGVPGVGSLSEQALNAARSNSPISAIGLPNFPELGLSTPSLFNSSISLPNSLSPLNIASLISKNPAVRVAINPAISPTISQSTSYTSYSSEIIPDVQFLSPTYYSRSALNNSSINVNIPEGLTSYSIQRTIQQNPGKDYNIYGSVFKVNQTKKTVRKK